MLHHPASTLRLHFPRYKQWIQFIYKLCHTTNAKTQFKFNTYIFIQYIHNLIINSIKFNSKLIYLNFSRFASWPNWLWCFVRVGPTHDINATVQWSLIIMRVYCITLIDKYTTYLLEILFEIRFDLQWAEQATTRQYKCCTCVKDYVVTIQQYYLLIHTALAGTVLGSFRAASVNSSSMW